MLLRRTARGVRAVGSGFWSVFLKSLVKRSPKRDLKLAISDARAGHRAI
jgi:hypothetical protein